MCDITKSLVILDCIILACNQLNAALLKLLHLILLCHQKPLKDTLFTCLHNKLDTVFAKRMQTFSNKLCSGVPYLCLAEVCCWDCEGGYSISS